MAAERPPGARENPEKEASATAEEAPEPVDFDALHAALGELPPPPTSSRPLLSESQGRLNATYASVRPHAIPSARPPQLDPHEPAVIVAPEDTMPNPSTVPLAPGRPGGAGPGGRGGTARPRSLQPATPAAFAAAVPSFGDYQRTPTKIMRRPGPTKGRKLVVFLSMLIVFVGGGIAFLIYGKHIPLNLPGGR